MCPFSVAQEASWAILGFELADISLEDVSLFNMLTLFDQTIPAVRVTWSENVGLGLLVGLLVGDLMSHVDFKKWQCCMSLSLIFPDVPCRIKEICMSPVVIILESLSHVTMLHVPRHN